MRVGEGTDHGRLEEHLARLHELGPEAELKVAGGRHMRRRRRLPALSCGDVRRVHFENLRVQLSNLPPPPRAARSRLRARPRALCMREWSPSRGSKEAKL